MPEVQPSISAVRGFRAFGVRANIVCPAAGNPEMHPPIVGAEHWPSLPGDPERRTREQRLKEGIPIDDGTWGQLVDLAGKLAVALP